MTDTRKYIEEQFDKFFEFDTHDKSTVTSTSCKLFAEHLIADLLAVIERKDAAFRSISRYGQSKAEIDLMIDEALAITADGVELVEVTHLKFRAVLHGGNHEHGPESHEWLEQCSKGDVGDDGLEAFPVYTIKQKP